MNHILNYNDLIFNKAQKYDAAATTLWSRASGYSQFKKMEFYQCNLANTDMVNRYDENNERFKRILWTRDVISVASVVGAGICFDAGFSIIDTLGVYSLLLISFTLALRVYMTYSEHLDIKGIRGFPAMAKTLKDADDRALNRRQYQRQEPVMLPIAGEGLGN